MITEVDNEKAKTKSHCVLNKFSNSSVVTT